MNSKLTHIDKNGDIKMVNISGKQKSKRIAKASGEVFASEETLKIINNKKMPKGNVFSAAKIAGIMAAKKTSEIIPLCHPLNLTNIEVEFMLPFWIAAKNATNHILMCGQGADELFGGYARFRKENAKKNLKKEVADLLERIPERERKITEFFGLELACPYLEENVIRYLIMKVSKHEKLPTIMMVKRENNEK